MRRLIAIVIMLGSGFSALAALGDSGPAPVPDWTGPRALVTADQAAGWEAVGRIDSGSSFCSGTLIAADLVLTAAHCLYDRRDNQRFGPEDLRFSAGLRNGQVEAIRLVRRMWHLPDYRFEIGEDLSMIGRDLALLELQHPIPEEVVRPIPLADLGRVRDGMTIVSYGEDREGHASIEEGCAVLARNGAVRSLNCQAVSGASGAPVLRVIDGRPQVVAVVSAVGYSDGEEFSLAVALDGQVGALLAARDTQPAVVARRLPSIGDDATQSDGGRSTLGARFLRP